VAVSHLALDFRLWHQRGDGVDDHNVDGAGADEHIGDLQRLLASVRLGHQQRVGVDAEVLGVVRVECVLCVDERGDATCFLRVRYSVQRQTRLP